HVLGVMAVGNVNQRQQCKKQEIGQPFHCPLPADPLARKQDGDEVPSHPLIFLGAGRRFPFIPYLIHIALLFSAILSRALRARLFRSISSASGRTGFLLSASKGFSSFPYRSFSTSPLNFPLFTKFFTSRSSREW